MLHRQDSNKRFILNLCLHMSCVFLTSCASIKPMVSNTKAIPSLPQYWLTTSMYAGPFYEDADLLLIDYRPLNSIDDAKTPDDRIIYPPTAEYIIPAGTLVQILKISYPNTPEAQKRPL